MKEIKEKFEQVEKGDKAIKVESPEQHTEQQPKKEVDNTVVENTTAAQTISSKEKENVEKIVSPVFQKQAVATTVMPTATAITATTTTITTTTAAATGGKTKVPLLPLKDTTNKN